jgi:transcription elongation GreA/GreB family factor
MDIADKLEQLRQKLKELQKHREHAIMEKGLAAQENQDLRENSDYDYWEMEESNFTFRIHNIIREIESFVEPKKKLVKKAPKKVV